MAATWKSLIVFGILGAALLMIGVPADPCAILYSVEANAGRDSLRASFSVERVNVSSTGEQADSYSSWPSLSANGRFAAFSSVARISLPTMAMTTMISLYTTVRAA